MRNLERVWRNCAAAGSRNLIIARVVELDATLDRIREAVPGAEVHLVRLRASPGQLRERIRRREVGSGEAWHERRARELAELLDRRALGRVVETDGRSPKRIARELAASVEWR